MTHGEYLRARHDDLSAKMVKLAIRVIENAYKEVEKYYFGCGKYAGLKSERDIVEAELQKLDKSGGDLEDMPDPLDDDDTAPNVVRQPKRAGNLRLGGGRPAGWGG